MKKPAKIKIPSLFTKRYTEKKYRKKILSKLFVPADKALVESLFVAVANPKRGEPLHTIDANLVTDKETAKKLAKIAKDIKKQKGRINIGAVALALVCVIALVLALVAFRNQIARAAIVSAMQGTFGAKCEIRDLDINILDTHFRIDGLSVANRNKPMTDLFGIGHLELHFNLLELTRGKFIVETVQITGVSRGAGRTTNGSLPPRAEKKYQKKLKSSKPNPVQQKLEAEAAKIASGVSVDSGISALKDQLDPAKYLESEKASLQSPAVVDEVQSTVPALVAKWQAKVPDARKQADEAVAQAKNVSQIRSESLKTVEDVKAALETINKARASAERASATAQSSLADFAADGEAVKNLSAKAQTAFAADEAKLESLASSIKDINLSSGSKMVSGLFDTFLIHTLGAYYPVLDRGMATLRSMQTGAAKNTELSLKKKASAIDRLPGRNFTFAKDDLPRFVMKDIEFSAADAPLDLALSANVKNVTNDQDALGVPLLFNADATHGKMSEKITGTVDLRSAATERLNSAFDVDGYHISIDPGSTPGVPSLSGTLGATGTMALSPDGTLSVETAMTIDAAVLTIPPFEPAYLSGIYRDVLADVTTIDLDVHAVISPDRDIDLSVTSGIDDDVARALKKELAGKTGELKAEIRKQGEAWLAEQKKNYASEISRFDAVAGQAKSAMDDAKGSEKIIDAKKAELEKRVTGIADEKAAEVQRQANAAAADARKKAEKEAASKIKKLF
jgi:uncharacterized protein (TIGR03545 family)